MHSIGATTFHDIILMQLQKCNIHLSCIDYTIEYVFFNFESGGDAILAQIIAEKSSFDYFV